MPIRVLKGAKIAIEVKVKNLGIPYTFSSNSVVWRDSLVRYPEPKEGYRFSLGSGEEKVLKFYHLANEDGNWNVTAVLSDAGFRREKVVSNLFTVEPMKIVETSYSSGIISSFFCVALVQRIGDALKFGFSFGNAYKYTTITSLKPKFWINDKICFDTTLSVYIRPQYMLTCYTQEFPIVGLGDYVRSGTNVFKVYESSFAVGNSKSFTL